MTVLYSKLCYNEVCHKGSALYGQGLLEVYFLFCLFLNEYDSKNNGWYLVQVMGCCLLFKCSSTIQPRVLSFLQNIMCYGENLNDLLL